MAERPAAPAGRAAPPGLRPTWAGASGDGAQRVDFFSNDILSPYPVQLGMAFS